MLVGVSEDVYDNGMPIYVVSYSKTTGKDDTNLCREKAKSIFDEHFGKPFQEESGRNCDFLLYKRRFDA